MASTTDQPPSNMFAYVLHNTMYSWSFHLICGVLCTYVFYSTTEESIDSPFYSSVNESDLGRAGKPPVSSRINRWLRHVCVRITVVILELLRWVRDKVEREVFKMKKKKVQSSADVTRNIHFNRPDRNFGYPTNYIRLVGSLYVCSRYFWIILASDEDQALTCGSLLCFPPPSFSTSCLSCSTGKYTLWSFIFKFLWEQFRKMVNLYFLVIALLQVCESTHMYTHTHTHTHIHSHTH